jgi:hypothetical protein
VGEREKERERESGWERMRETGEIRSSGVGKIGTVNELGI